MHVALVSAVDFGTSRDLPKEPLYHNVFLTLLRVHVFVVGAAV